MSKLPKEHKFIDLSDYGRIPARILATSIKNTSLTPIHVTVSFIVSGIIGIICILNNQFLAAGFFLILKSVLDAADGELARIKKTPSYTGRYFDSVADILLNLLIFLAIWHITDSNLFSCILAFLGIQLQGTLYNYYYTILRNRHNGDTTSRVFENEVPIALPGEKQKHVNILFGLYKILYGGFDKIIYRLDRSAAKSKNFPNWLMTLVSTFGLGFQLLVISIMLVSGFKDYIIPFFILYSVMIFVFIGIRKTL
ncbi:CDP-alcohol phosphatidyltransferase family protein [Xanthomarina sp. F2636L]|uniref:CDP-alcohol phosphatidyltransferase family protein n=1 Tax=Xanthomarina sp. F2636L TaxID=2996018 RepID=UPI00225DF15F|nr:CDP-alcohol phosphatidyltransferase family protein [Xanthomarina sp. F2636L]MCX7549816.1 CDP-alcohol phosphatidyltransferase family protein [Xanthomarina sp. F2636L]